MSSAGFIVLTAFLLQACASTTPPLTVQRPLLERREVQAFIDDMAARHGFDRARLAALFGRARELPDIVAAMSRPYEAKPWYQYRPLFVNSARAEEGLAFWNANADTLARAHRAYGVPPQIIVAIIGVETRYGKQMGRYSVLDALTTLAFDYPPRAQFFQTQLEDFLLLTRAQKIDPLTVMGSYAGAMGQPQFLPSSFRRYAVDFDGDGRCDLWNDSADAIGSVANYFKAHGWKTGQPVTSRARLVGHAYLPLLLDPALEPKLTLAQLKRDGVIPDRTLANDLHGALIGLEGRYGMEYWVGLRNFYVITRYNHSPLYAMAVYQLSQKILRLHDRQEKSPGSQTPP
ncbi:MAG: lytic murein transglycosylase B [Gammaproteobacteria bacterium]|nr:lytic murein transglycosylase B [Gammaproteobacteria bacterium]